MYLSFVIICGKYPRKVHMSIPAVNESITVDKSTNNRYHQHEQSLINLSISIPLKEILSHLTKMSEYNTGITQNIATHYISCHNVKGGLSIGNKGWQNGENGNELRI